MSSQTYSQSSFSLHNPFIFFLANSGASVMFHKNTIKRLIKVSCVVQFLNAFVDYVLWFTTGFLVPSWTISTIIMFYSIILLAYDRL
jgi:hypothetical protein